MEPSTASIKDYLRAQIYRGELAEGAQIFEEDVKRRSGASYRIVREALRELAREGLLTRKRHVGTFVARELPRHTSTALPRMRSVAILSSMSQHGFHRNPYIQILMDGIGSSLQPPGQISYLIRTENESFSVDSLPPIDTEQLRQSAQGVLGIEANHAPTLDALAREGFPVVAIDFYAIGAGFDTVMPDYTRAGYLATRHLLAQGHRNIAFIGEGASDESLDPAWQERLNGYLRAMAGSSGETGAFSILDISRNAKQVNALLPAFHDRHHPSAYVLADGRLVAPAVQALKTLSLECPQDVSLATADGLQHPWEGGIASGARVNFEQVGQTAVKMLAARMACPAMPAARVRIEATFKAGSSSSTPSRSASKHY